MRFAASGSSVGEVGGIECDVLRRRREGVKDVERTGRGLGERPGRECEDEVRFIAWSLGILVLLVKRRTAALSSVEL